MSNPTPLLQAKAHSRLPPPDSIPELLQRAEGLCGLKAGELARRLGEPLGSDPVRTKGRIGEIVERALGAHARNLDVPDFPHLGVELKTIPLDRAGRVRESTFVCAIDLSRLEEETWERSRLWRKLRRVLWVPVEAGPALAPAERRLGRPFLWCPDGEQEATLRADWTLLIGRMAVGGLEEIDAHMGTALQVRPKAAHGRVRCEASGPHLEPIRTVPRGFYLRARFTETVLWALSSVGAPRGKA